MMKQTLLRACLAAGLASLTLSCSLQESDIQDAFSPGERFYARIETPDGPDTKVYADDKLRVLWDSDDHISIFNKYTYNQEYRFAGKTGDNAGSFKIVPNDDFVTGNELDLVYAVYPYQESTSIDNDGVLSVSLPAMQTYRENSFGRGANTMVSCTANNQLMFKNVCGYLSLKLYGDNVSVSSISIKGNKGESLAGDAIVLATTGNEPAMEFMEESTGEITLVMEEPVVLPETSTEARTFWLVIPPTVFSEGFTLTVTNPEGDTFEKTTSKSFTINRNTLSRMSALNVTMSGASDLSADGTANSYLVPSAGTFKFKADVKGNSTLVLNEVPVSAEVLWETFNTEQVPETGSIVRNVRFKEGYVFFETTGNPGNALIAVKDANGTILWSWHIWATPYNPETEFDTYTDSGAEMMNRNLGALSNTPGDALANGLLYQWGRKDPFLGSCSTDQSTTSAAVPEGVANQMVSRTGETGNVDYATKHPTHFIKADNLDWMSSPDYTLWASDKTQYDPCPPGWKVPSASVYANWQNVSYDYTNHGVLFGAPYSSPATWYPFSGQIFGELSDVGDRFDHWTVTHDGASAVSPHAGSDYFNLTSYYDMSSIGQSVRCVRESYQDKDVDESLIPHNQIWYTTDNGNIFNKRYDCHFYNNNGDELSFTQKWDGKKWIMTFSDDVSYWEGDWFYVTDSDSRLVSLGVPSSLDPDRMTKAGFYQKSFSGDYISTIENFYGQYEGIADQGHLFLTGKDLYKLSGIASAYEGTLSVPEGTTDIGVYAFVGSKAKTIILPSTIKTIEDFAFENCYNLTDIYCYAEKCPEFKDGTSVWTYVYGTSGVLHYPAESDYSEFPVPSEWSKVADLSNWDGFRLKATSENTVLVLTHDSLDKYPGRDLFYSFNTIDWVKWEYDAEVHLDMNQNLYLKGENLIFGDTCRIEAKSGTAYGSGYVCSLFDNGTDYTTSSIPAQALQGIFVEDGGITGELRFPDVVKTIGSQYLYAYTCHGPWWTSVILPKELEFIGCTSFENNRMTEITIPKTVKYIGDAAFNGCRQLSTVYFTGTVEEWEAIEKGDYRWEVGPPATTIICSDGEANF